MSAVDRQCRVVWRGPNQTTEVMVLSMFNETLLAEHARVKAISRCLSQVDGESYEPVSVMTRLV